MIFMLFFGRNFYEPLCKRLKEIISYALAINKYVFRLVEHFLLFSFKRILLFKDETEFWHKVY